MALFEKTIESSNSDSHQSNPWAHIIALPYKDPKSNGIDGIKKDQIFDEVMATSEISINSDILSIDISETKSQFSNLANITLASGNINYSESLHAGDHIVIWLGDGSDKHQNLKNNLKKGLRCNGSDSGLKFIGKINSVRATMTTTGSGVRTVRYTITAAGFTEFGATIYFSEALRTSFTGDVARGGKSISFLSSISTKWTDLVFGSTTESQSSQGFIRFFINVFLGVGPEKTKVLDKNYTSNRSFFIPKRLNEILTGTSQSVSTYTDILHRIIGIQKYSSNSYYPEFGINNSETQESNEFICDNLYGGMLGAPEIFNSTVWSQIDAYRNEQLNEAYTATRMNNEGYIFPHFITRQLPFTNDSFTQEPSNSEKSIKTTPFSSLPVWKVSNNWPVYSFNIGTSDASRFNCFQAFPHLMGEGVNGKTLNAQEIAISENNLVVYDADVIRNGPRNKVSRLYNNPIKDGVTNSRRWSFLLSDWYKDGHLKFNGTVDMAGVTLPISIGDNLKISDKLFHIEQISHRYMVSDNGQKTFTTSLALSRGLTVATGLDNKLNPVAVNEVADE